MSVAFTDANFGASVLQSSQLTIVDFWAPWCGSCIALGPAVDAIAESYKGQVQVGKINVDENPEVSVRFGITSIPAILFIKDGKVVDKQMGLASRKTLEQKLLAHLEVSPFAVS